jgi:hypothetical protein
MMVGGPTFGLFDPTLDLRREKVEGLGDGLVFGPYRENAAELRRAPSRLT